jgi:hypothetical protein
MNTRFLVSALRVAVATIGLLIVATTADAAPAEMLTNGDFVRGETNWTLEQTGGATGQIDIVREGPSGKAALRLKVLTLADQPWNLQICQKGIQIKKGVTYTLSFWAKSDHPVRISVNCMQNHAPWEHHGAAEEVALSTEWQETQFQFVGPYDDDNMRVTFTNLAVAVSQRFWFADCSLREIPPPQTRR